jgi:hypothetical protein
MHIGTSRFHHDVAAVLVPVCCGFTYLRLVLVGPTSLFVQSLLVLGEVHVELRYHKVAWLVLSIQFRATHDLHKHMPRTC